MIRPILVASIGYVLGIIIGLYLKSMVLFYILIPMLALFLIITKNKNRQTKFKLISFHRYSRYIKLIVDFKVIILILITILIGYLHIKILNYRYEDTYQEMESLRNIQAEGIIVSNRTEKQYKNIYEIKIEKINDKKIVPKKFYCYIKKNEEIKYGSRVEIKGEYQKPQEQRNSRRI